METQTKENLPVGKSPSLEGNCPTPHVAIEDVNAFLKLAAGGLVPIEIGACGAVQNGYMFAPSTTAPLDAE